MSNPPDKPRSRLLACGLMAWWAVYRKFPAGCYRLPRAHPHPGEPANGGVLKDGPRAAPCPVVPAKTRTHAPRQLLSGHDDGRLCANNNALWLSSLPSPGRQWSVTQVLQIQHDGQITNSGFRKACQARK